MIDFSGFLDLPLIWGGLIATAISLYVILDGFDLGCGILFPFAPSDKCRDRIMNSIAPFWDGNETWLVLGGGGLFVAFPVAYAILMPAFYIPICFMLIGLIFRGVAFEFRFKASKKQRKIWDISFHIGSILAAFMQGMILGNFVQGIEVTGNSFSGGPLDWATGFSMLSGIGVVFGYALIGSTWLIMKTEDETQSWARGVARYVFGYIVIAMISVSIAMPIVEENVFNVWFSMPNILYLSLIPIITALLFFILWKSLRNKASEYIPFFSSIGLFFMGYLGLIISIYPWIVPFKKTLWDAAAVGTSQTFTLIGMIFLLPIILCYTAYCYYIFRGKSSHEKMY